MALLDSDSQITNGPSAALRGNGGTAAQSHRLHPLRERTREAARRGKLSTDEKLAALVLTSMSHDSVPEASNGGLVAEAKNTTIINPAAGHVANQAPSDICNEIFCHESRECSTLSDLQQDDVGHIDYLPWRKYMCTWKGCGMVTACSSTMENHIRYCHLSTSSAGPQTVSGDHEEDFYYVELDVFPDDKAMVFGLSREPHQTDPGVPPAFSQANTPLFDHDYQKKLPEAYRKNSRPRHKILRGPASETVRAEQRSRCSLESSRRALKTKSELSNDHHQSSNSHIPKDKNDIKKCRKVYGMTNKRFWCTQCKWKKACSRFMLQTS